MARRRTGRGGEECFRRLFAAWLIVVVALSLEQGKGELGSHSFSAKIPLPETNLPE